MSTRNSISQPFATAAAAVMLLGGGCSTPGANPESATAPAAEAARPNFGPSVTDTRTEATIQQMEIDYIAAKNSRPTYQHIAAAEKKAKEEAQAEAARKAEAEKETGTNAPEAKE